jgi:hypothetical protein
MVARAVKVSLFELAVVHFCFEERLPTPSRYALSGDYDVVGYSFERDQRLGAHTHKIASLMNL